MRDALTPLEAMSASLRFSEAARQRGFRVHVIEEVTAADSSHASEVWLTSPGTDWVHAKLGPVSAREARRVVRSPISKVLTGWSWRVSEGVRDLGEAMEIGAGGLDRVFGHTPEPAQRGENESNVIYVDFKARCRV